MSQTFYNRGEFQWLWGADQLALFGDKGRRDGTRMRATMQVDSGLLVRLADAIHGLPAPEVGHAVYHLMHPRPNGAGCGDCGPAMRARHAAVEWRDRAPERGGGFDAEHAGLHLTAYPHEASGRWNAGWTRENERGVMAEMWMAGGCDGPEEAKQEAERVARVHAQAVRARRVEEAAAGLLDAQDAVLRAATVDHPPEGSEEHGALLARRDEAWKALRAALGRESKGLWP
jgi:hypothetical protein